MKFYRPLGEIRAISFDLDDTLYDNTPVLLAAEQALMEHLHQHFPNCRHLGLDDWRALRQGTIDADPRLAHHVTNSRLKTLESGLRQSGYSSAEASAGAQQAFEVLLEARNQVPVPQQTLEALEALAQRVPLVALTNGNADIQRIGIGQFFRFAIQAEQLWAAKPEPAMFEHASKRLNIDPDKILHVGDNLHSDVYGALRSGYQACWFNDGRQVLREQEHARLLPHVEIHELAALITLLEAGS